MSHLGTFGSLWSIAVSAVLTLEPAESSEHKHNTNNTPETRCAQQYRHADWSLRALSSSVPRVSWLALQEATLMTRLAAGNHPPLHIIYSTSCLSDWMPCGDDVKYLLSDGASPPVGSWRPSLSRCTLKAYVTDLKKSR